MKIHMIAERTGHRVKTFCGIVGIDEGALEFTRTDGRESRYDYAAAARDVTCLRCRSLIAKAQLAA